MRKIDTTAFNANILQSKLFGELELDADGYADLFDAEVQRVLDIHASLRTGRRRCGQHDSCHLSDEARQAKQQRRRLERRYRRTGLSDKEADFSACSTARESILKSPADHINSELDEAAGDFHATWRTAQRLLHSRHKVVWTTPRRATIVSTFYQFFVDKVRRIRDNISARRTFVVRQHFGPQLSTFESLTTEEVRKLLSGMPSKSSLLDVLPCSLLKSCAHVIAPATARLANLSLQTGKFSTRYKKAQVLHCFHY